MRRRLGELDNPADTLRQISSLCPLELGRTVVAAVRLTDQVVTGAKAIADPLPRDLDDGDLARSIAEELVPERGSVTQDHGGISHVLITVVCRDGYVIPTRREFDWLRAWRYSNHFRGAFDGDVYVVTPHGWTGALDERAGFEPSLGGTRRLALATRA